MKPETIESLNLNLEVNVDWPISDVRLLRPGSPINTVYDCQHLNNTLVTQF